MCSGCGARAGSAEGWGVDAGTMLACFCVDILAVADTGFHVSAILLARINAILTNELPTRLKKQKMPVLKIV